MNNIDKIYNNSGTTTVILIINIPENSYKTVTKTVQSIHNELFYSLFTTKLC